MCLQDLQIGKLTRSVVSRVLIGSGPTTFLRRDANRVAVTIASESEFSIGIIPELAADGNTNIPLVVLEPTQAAVDPGFTVSRFVHHFTLQQHGDLPTRSWSAVGSDSLAALVVIEYLLPEEVLHLTPEELRQRSR